MSEEYRVKVTVRNNLIMKAIEDEGYTNLAVFAKDKGLSLVSLYDVVNLKKAPINTEGEFYPACMRLMEVLGACPSDLWTAEQLTMALRKNHSTVTLGKEAMVEALNMNARAAVEMVEDKILKDEMVTAVGARLSQLPEREAMIIKMRFGLDGYDSKTYEAIAKEMGVTRERVRQIEAKGLRTLRLGENSLNVTHKLLPILEGVDE